MTEETSTPKVFDTTASAEPQTVALSARSTAGLRATAEPRRVLPLGFVNRAAGENPDFFHGAAVTLDPLTVEAAATVGDPPIRTVIIRTVTANPVVVRLTALSLLNEIELKIETLRAQGSNSEITELHDLKRRVEEFLAAHAKGDEGPIADTAVAISDDLRRLVMHENVRDIGLLGVGLSFCAAAGALGVSDPVILAISAIAGGKRVGDVLNAAANLIWGKGKDEKKS